MPFQMFTSIREKLSVAVITAVILGVLVFVWRMAIDNGQLITLLGGVSASKIEDMLPFPKGAVVAFDLDQGCPEGWSNFEDAYERTIIGATGPPFPEHPYAFRTKGGKENIMLTEQHIPLHDHPYTDVYFTEVDRWRPNTGTTREDVPEGLGHATHNGRGETVDNDNTGWARPKFTGTFGHDDDVRSAHTNLQPYIALHFCKRQ